MKKDIETLIAEERADILTKYDKVRDWIDFIAIIAINLVAWLSFPGLTPHNRFPPGRQVCGGGGGGGLAQS
ncbi:hypothetical protein CRUP_018381 [Coryphaenoides rupestris]|nr:hypothetical protein CRUP_018381 [Coryphaenoides rupestris]